MSTLQNIIPLFFAGIANQTAAITTTITKGAKDALVYVAFAVVIILLLYVIVVKEG